LTSKKKFDFTPFINLEKINILIGDNDRIANYFIMQTLENSMIEEITLTNFKEVDFTSIHKLKYLKSIYIICNIVNYTTKIINEEELVNNIPKCDKFNIVLEKCTGIDKLKLIKNVVVR
jgi:hypothetical protein